MTCIPGVFEFSSGKISGSSKQCLIAALTINNF